MNPLVERPGQGFASAARHVLPSVRTSGTESGERNRHRLSAPFCRLGSVLLLLVIVSGCGSGKPAWERVHPVSGTLKFGGQPIEGAMLVFYPKSASVPESVRPIGKTDASGNFDIGTYSVDDGIPEGDFDVTVTWNPLVDVGAGPSPGPNRLPVRYSNRQTSQLVVHISADESELKPIELTP